MEPSIVFYVIVVLLIAAAIYAVAGLIFAKSTLIQRLKCKNYKLLARQFQYEALGGKLKEEAFVACEAALLGAGRSCLSMAYVVVFLLAACALGAFGSLG